MMFVNLIGQVPSYIPTNGLKAWYPFSGNANDLSGSNFNGTVNGANLTTDRFGVSNAAYLFDTLQDIIVQNTQSQNYYPLTISLWYNVNTFQANTSQNIFSKYLSASWNGYQILFGDNTNIQNNNSFINNGFGTQSWYARNFNSRVIGYFNSPSFIQPNININTWYHYVFVLDSSGGKIFVNGQLISSDTWDGIPGASTSNFLWKIGGKYDGNTWFKGKIDDIGIWNRALTPQEITDLHQSCNTPIPSGNNLQTFCGSVTLSNLAVTGSGIKWYATNSGGAPLSSSTQLVNGTTYYASQTLNGCESKRLAVGVIINNPTLMAADTNICSGTSVILTANSNQNASQIQTQVNMLINSGFWTLKKTFNNHNYFEYKNRMNWPQAKLLCEQHGGYMYCVNSKIENDSVSVLIANSQLYGDFLIGLYQDKADPSYSEPSGGWKWLDGTSLSYSNWASNQPSGGSEDYGIIDWNNMGEFWNDTYDNINGTVIMEYPNFISSKYLWSTGDTSAKINVTPNTTTQYWVDITTNGKTCRKYITITVKTTPNAPTGNNLQAFCGSATLSNLAVVGSGIKWYATNSGGASLLSSTQLVNGTTYYASQTLNGCESKRLAIGVVINNPTLLATSTQICKGQSTELTANNNVSVPNYSIGSVGPAGGYIFYDKGNTSNGWRYLEVAPNDISVGAQWGCNTQQISGISNMIGSGLTNTNLILSNCSVSGIAAKVCEQAIINGYSDWYLPSKAEFDLIYQNIHLQGHGNFVNNTGPNNSVIMYNRYWTSSQVSIPNGWAQDFSPYYQQVVSKLELNRVRPIRQFALSSTTYLWSTGDTTSKINVSPTMNTQYWVDITTNGATCRKFITIQVTNNTTNVIPAVLNAKINDTGVFVSTKTIGSEIIWQSNNANLGWSDLVPNQKYQLFNSSKILQINELNVQNHLHKFRVISTLNGCNDTSNLVYINIADTCIVKDTLYDTIYHHISVTDTLIINVSLSSLVAPNNTNQIKIYPNPAKDYIWIDYGNYSFMNTYSMKISNMLGQVVYNQNVTQQKVQIDLNSWTGRGTYLLELFDNGQLIESKKIILE